MINISRWDTPKQKLFESWTISKSRQYSWDQQTLGPWSAHIYTISFHLNPQFCGRPPSQVPLPSLSFLTILSSFGGQRSLVCPYALHSMKDQDQIYSVPSASLCYFISEAQVHMFWSQLLCHLIPQTRTEHLLHLGGRLGSEMLTLMKQSLWPWWGPIQSLRCMFPYEIYWKKNAHWSTTYSIFVEPRQMVQNVYELL